MGRYPKDAYIVWAVTHSGETPRNRFMSPFREAAERAAFEIARSSGDDGAVSVWIEYHREPIWAAGEKAQALIAAGYEIDKELQVVGKRGDTP